MKEKQNSDFTTVLLSAAGTAVQPGEEGDYTWGAAGTCRSTILLCRPPHCMGHVENILPVALPWALSFAELGFHGI